MAINNQLNTATVPIAVATTTVTLSSANIQAMYVTPVVLIPAQGANTSILVLDIFNEYIFNTTAYADGDPIQIQYNNVGSDASPGSFIFYSSNILAETSSTFLGIDAGGGYTIPNASAINKGIYISNQSAPYTGGNSTLKVTLTYAVITTTA